MRTKVVVSPTTETLCECYSGLMTRLETGGVTGQ